MRASSAIRSSTASASTVTPNSAAGRTHRVAGRAAAEEVEPECGREPAGNRRKVGLQGREVVLAHREQGPTVVVLEGRAELSHDLAFRRLIAGVERQQFLELVEYQERLDGPVEVGARMAGEEGGEVASEEIGGEPLGIGPQQVRQGFGVAAGRLGPGRFERDQDAEQVAVHPAPVARSGACDTRMIGRSWNPSPAMRSPGRPGPGGARSCPLPTGSRAGADARRAAGWSGRRARDPGRRDAGRAGRAGGRHRPRGHVAASDPRHHRLRRGRRRRRLHRLPLAVQVLDEILDAAPVECDLTTLPG